jgi:hypothetical protein
MFMWLVYINITCFLLHCQMITVYCKYLPDEKERKRIRVRRLRFRRKHSLPFHIYIFSLVCLASGKSQNNHILWPKKNWPTDLKIYHLTTCKSVNIVSSKLNNTIWKSITCFAKEIIKYKYTKCDIGTSRVKLQLLKLLWTHSLAYLSHESVLESQSYLYI